MRFKRKSRLIITLASISLLGLNFNIGLAQEKILAEGNISFLSCQKIYDRFFLIYSKNDSAFGELFVKEFDSHWQELAEKKLGVCGSSASLAYYNNKFYVAYTSYEKEGNVRLSEFGPDFNFIRDMLITPTTYSGEWAYQLINIDDGNLYLLYARNWGDDCGLKMAKLNRYLEVSEEINLMRGNANFHLSASEFSGCFANGGFYVAYKKTLPQTGMDIFVDEYTPAGELINTRCIDKQEKLSPALFFDRGIFYLAYEGYDYDLMKQVIYLKQYNAAWGLAKEAKIITPETGAPRKKTILVSEDKSYLVGISMEDITKQKIFLKEIDWDKQEKSGAPNNQEEKYDHVQVY